MTPDAAGPSGRRLQTEPSLSTRLLVTYVTAGTGHRRAAEAIAESLLQRHPAWPVECVDVLQATPGWFRRGYPAVYKALVKHASATWAMGYGLLDTRPGHRVVQPLRHAWNRMITAGFIRDVERRPPAVVIATHFLPADVFGALRRTGRLACPVVVVVTDQHPHRLWLSPGADAIVVGSEDARQLCQAHGVPPDRLHVIGIPVGAAFAPAADPGHVRRTLQWHPDKATVLLAGGGMGIGPIEPIARILARRAVEVSADVQLAVVCGDNAELTARLKRDTAGAPVPVHVYGFIGQMSAFMQASDLLITKAGGLTVTEALAAGLPMVFCGSIPGQEQSNAEYVLRHGAGMEATSPGEAAAMVLRLLAQPDLLASMRQAALALARPDAAQQIVDRIVTPLLTTSRPS